MRLSTLKIDKKPGEADATPRLIQRAEPFKRYIADHWTSPLGQASADVVGIEAGAQVLDEPDGRTGEADSASRRHPIQ